MQSEYPLSVLMVVPPWPGPVEQNPEPTTPTGPPRPAAAAAATLSRYQGYIERAVRRASHRVPLPNLLSSETWLVPSEFQANIHSRHVPIFPRFSLSLSLFLGPSLLPTFPRYGHDTRRATYTSPPMVSLHRGARDIAAVHAALAHNRAPLRVRPVPRELSAGRGNVDRARNTNHWHSRTRSSVSRPRTPGRSARTASGSRVPARVPRSRERPIRTRGTVIDVVASAVRPSVNAADAAAAVAKRSRDGVFASAYVKT